MAENETEATPPQADEPEGPADSTAPADMPGPAEAESQEPEEIDLGLGEALTLEEAARIAASARAQVLIIAGAVESGKTTLVASLFHLFQRGPFAGYLFAGSASLVGFDRRCFLARTASDREEMGTARTRPGETRTFLHLRTRPEDLSSAATDLLVFDLSGEDYKQAKDSVGECRQLGVLRRADHFVLLVDGEQLSDIAQRQKARNEPCMLLRSCLDAGQLHEHSLVDILFTKWDLVEPEQARTEHTEFVEDVTEDFKQRFSDRVGRLRFSMIAARPTKPGPYSLGHGMADLLPSWVKERPRQHVRERVPVATQSLSECDRYLLRRLPDVLHEAR